MLRATGRITRVLKKGLPNGFKGVYKINIVGSTGSGKTTFLKCLLGDLFKPTSESKRRSAVENSVDSTHTWFRIGNKQKTESTTTISLNTAGILLIRTLFNSIEFHPINKAEELLLRDDIEDIYQLMFFDTPGQERFDFMPEITMRGADAVIVLIDGTNMSSVTKVSFFLELARKEEYRSSDGANRIPMLILLNKSDLATHGAYLGLDSIKHMIGEDAKYDFYETSMVNKEGVDDSIRGLMSRLEEGIIEKE